MRIVITGAGGMLARDLLPVLSLKHEVLGLDHGNCDITDPEAVERPLKNWRPDLIVNCAAFPDVDGCELDPNRAFAVNGQGTGNLAFAATTVGARLFHISTDQVFDGHGRTPYREDDSVGPINVYGLSKLEGEKRVLQNDPYGRHMILRTSWLYGIHRPNFVEGVIAQAQSRKCMAYVADQICCPTWTLHLARKIAELAEVSASGIVHVAGGGECSRQEFASYVVQKLGIPIPIEPVTWAKLNRPAKRPAYSVLGSSRLGELGLSPLPHWKTAVDEYLRIRETNVVGVDRN